MITYNLVSNLGFNSIADFCAIFMCILNIVLLHSTYTGKSKSRLYYRLSNVGLIIAASSDILYHAMCSDMTEAKVIPTYILHDMTYMVLGAVFILFIFYMADVVKMRPLVRNILRAFVAMCYIDYFIHEIMDDFTHTGFYITEPGLGIHNSFFNEPFRFLYMTFFALMPFYFLFYKKKFITKMYWALVVTMFISLGMMLIQNYIQQSSFTIISFVIPLITVLFFYHYNSYDQATGSLDEKAFTAYLTDIIGKKEFGFVSLLLLEVDESKMSLITDDFFHFNDRYFRSHITFRLMNNHIVLVYEKSKNKNVEETLERMFSDFSGLYEKFGLDFKVVCGTSDSYLKSANDYINFIKYIEQMQPDNTFYCCFDEDYRSFEHRQFVKDIVENIYRTNDLLDSRVRVFCQPVYNTVTHKFTTAEALMRIETEDGTMLTPDEFIPVAEKHNFIHVLSCIILNKTCIEIKKLMDEGYVLDRISVNFSAQELKIPDFCQQVEEIIDANNIPHSKVAFELTESRNDSDFETMKSVISKLREYGIVFYLDDFGTGYSNIERILGLPMDIIKFDRSLTIMSSQSDSYRYMVGSFSDIFKNSNYCILFEGVEDENDELRCTSMNAKYLQGFKYSKPIPIDRLREFLDKESPADSFKQIS